MELLTDFVNLKASFVNDAFDWQAQHSGCSFDGVAGVARYFTIILDTNDSGIEKIKKYKVNMWIVDQTVYLPLKKSIITIYNPENYQKLQRSLLKISADLKSKGVFLNNDLLDFSQNFAQYEPEINFIDNKKFIDETSFFLDIAKAPDVDNQFLEYCQKEFIFAGITVGEELENFGQVTKKLISKNINIGEFILNFLIRIHQFCDEILLINTNIAKCIYNEENICVKSISPSQLKATLPTISKEPDKKAKEKSAMMLEITEFLAKYKHLGTEPSYLKVSGIYREDWSSKKGFTEIVQPCEGLDLRTGFYTKVYRLPEQPEKFDIKILSLYRKIIQVFFGEHWRSFVEFCSLYAFEDRSGLARPVFVLMGDRSVGKSLTIDYIPGKIFPALTGVFPKTNFEQFTDYLDNKLVVGDEIEEVNIKKIVTHIKEVCGGTKVNIKEIYKKNVNRVANTWFVLSSNDKPLHISDYQDKNSELQWLVFNFQQEDIIINGNETKTRLEWIKSLKQEAIDLGFGNLGDFLEKNIAVFIWGIAHDIYIELKDRCRKNHYRYGMNVPHTDGFKKLTDMSRNSEKDEGLRAIFEDLITQQHSGYFFESWHTEDFLGFLDDEFLAIKTIKKMCERHKIEYNYFKKICIKQKLMKINSELKHMDLQGTQRIYYFKIDKIKEYIGV